MCLCARDDGIICWFNFAGRETNGFPSDVGNLRFPYDPSLCRETNGFPYDPFLFAMVHAEIFEEG
jgi:hypothetical protein